MDMHRLTRELNVRNENKIVMLVADGLGGLPLQSQGQTELATAPGVRTWRTALLLKRTWVGLFS